MGRRATVKSERAECATIARKIERVYRRESKRASTKTWRERFDCYANVAQTIAENIEERGK